MAAAAPSLRKLGVADLALRGRRVLLRADFNVPLDKKTGAITNNQRISETLPTLKHILDNEASLVLLSHLGRPDGRRHESMSLKVVAEELNHLLSGHPTFKGPVIFVSQGVSEEASAIAQKITPGQVVLLENLRFSPAEEGSSVDSDGKKVKADKAEVQEFRRLLTTLGDVFVNDAFGTAHRAHSSMVGVSLEQRAAGFLMKKELDFFASALESPRRPFIAILGGAKVSDKIKLIDFLLEKVDGMIIGGGMAFTFKKVAGVKIGNSLFDQAGAELVPRILAKAQEKNVQIYLPVDFVTASKFANDADIGAASEETGIPDGYMGLDIGPKTRTLFATAARSAKTIIWNGPMGVFEFPNFKAGTASLLQAVADVTAADASAVTIIGGGDTATAAADLGFMDKVSHVSTGGGASLELLEGRELPGVSYLSPAASASARL